MLSGGGLPRVFSSAGNAGSPRTRLWFLGCKTGVEGPCVCFLLWTTSTPKTLYSSAANPVALCYLCNLTSRRQIQLIVMWWILGTAIWVILAVVTYSLFRAAATSDRRYEALKGLPAKSQSRVPDRKRPAA